MFKSKSVSYYIMYFYKLYFVEIYVNWVSSWHIRNQINFSYNIIAKRVAK